MIFDIPRERNAGRAWLRRYLRSRSFGCLQNSVWITPDSVEGEQGILAGGVTNVESLVLLEARACAGESDGEIVTGAWDFNSINNRYSQYLKILARAPGRSPKDKSAATKFLRWMSEERQAWLEAITLDPLLPARILPANYLGQKAWRRRVKAMEETAQQMAFFAGK